MRVAAWRIEDGAPLRVASANVALEEHLENWIAHDPSLAVEGLRVVGRQVLVESGRLDLLGIDPQGRWVAVEIKRGRLYRDTVAQALDYAAAISVMPTERLREIVEGNGAGDDPARDALHADEGDVRDVAIVVVGTGRDPSLDRLVSYLGENYGVPIQVVTFDVFALEDGAQMLVREVTEAEATPATEAASAARYSLEAVFGLATKWGAIDPFRLVFEAAQRHSLYARPWIYSVMYTPPTHRNRALVTASVTRDGEVRVWAGVDAFAEFYGFTATDVRSALGQEDEHVLHDTTEAKDFARRLDGLFATASGSEQRVHDADSDAA